MTWSVRSWFRENGELVYSDDGPYDRYLAELVISDIGRDASIVRGLGRTQVERAALVDGRSPSDVYSAAEDQAASPRTDL